ncbi:nicotinate dehydrogenase subunit A [Jezberella montanilacus]|uniref:Nicotinate dehydrogenase subunit A n=1 Tax=Jezberella montanilacus TaxID=323426 RepID=A0A2T0XG76_9BURK|nr:(2Fe-2S)-binding protein [Jezberella montanilacus]PRY97953.1 nicotinate dehydrogenase subunit A [Jezberella montanilacus]
MREADISPLTVSLRVNGVAHELLADPDTSLMTVLRNDLNLNGPKYGCGLGQCGACTVLVDGVAARSCVIPVGKMRDREIVTLEGLTKDGVLHPVQQAFIDAQAAQCGYCLNGMIMMTVSFLKDQPEPTEQQIRDALSGNLCRCGTHVEIIEAVKKASSRLVLNAQRER